MKIERNSYGEGDKEVTVYLENDDEIQFTVKEREYEAEELERAFEEGFFWARNQMLGENVSAYQIQTDLNFVTEVPGGILAEWLPSENEWIDIDGKVHNQDFYQGEQHTVALDLTLSYGEMLRTERVYVTVKKAELSKKEQDRLAIEKYILEKEAENRTEQAFMLPETIKGVKILEQPKTNMNGIIVIFVSCVLYLLTWKRKKTEKQEQKRREQLLRDYPLFVNKMVLYLAAGMPPKISFFSILKEREEYAGMSSHLYEELFLMKNEIEAGVNEKVAYENFGKRTKENQYIRLIGLLLQNYQKGSAGILGVLMEEEEIVFKNRIEQARRLSEEAGTKLLFPMLLLLIVVMIIVMAPAVYQFQSY